MRKTPPLSVALDLHVAVFSCYLLKVDQSRIFRGCHAGEARSLPDRMDAHGAGIFVLPDGALTPETVAVPRMACLSWPFTSFLPNSSFWVSFPATGIAATLLAAATHFRPDRFQE